MAWPFTGVTAPNLDSGVVNLTGSLVNVPTSTAAASWLLGVHLSNPTVNEILFNLTDGAANQIVKDLAVPPNSVVTIDWEFMPITGILQWKGSGLVGKLWGYI